MDILKRYASASAAPDASPRSTDGRTGSSAGALRRLWTPGRMASVCGGLVVLGPACNALVGVDFGEVHLADSGADSTRPVVDSGDAGDAGKPTTDAGHADAKDATARDAAHDSVVDTAHPTDAPRDSGVDGKSDAPVDARVDAFVCSPDATPMSESCVISSAEGVFVAPPASGGSDLTGTGSRAAPYATIQNGITKASGKRVYVCAAMYAEQLVVKTVDDGVQIYGGLACPESTDAGAHDAAAAAWSYTGALAVVAPTAPGNALLLQQLAIGAHFEDMAFEAVAAVAPGASSVAVLVEGSTGVSFRRVTGKSAAAATGVAGGAAASNACASSLAGASNAGDIGGVGATCTCPVTGATSTGGYGKPRPTTVNANQTGSSVPATMPLLGAPGISAVLVGASDCTAGNVGAPGSGGKPGAAGALGTLAATGWTGELAGAGGAGLPGQGGGGGGSGVVGGAAGGIGGCGGNGGPGGAGGGASLAFAIVTSEVSFSSVMLVSGAGGAGGLGGAGLVGQAGGPGGVAVPASPLDSCPGGTGGAGGGGGGGGGGMGGPSAGIGWVGTAPTVDGVGVSIGPLVGPSMYAGPTLGSSGGAGGAGAQTGVVGPAGTAGPTGVLGAVLEL